MAGTQQPNGTVAHSSAPQSAFLNHILNYPVVADTVTTVRKNHYGQQGIALGNAVYERVARPLLGIFAWPYSLVAPIVQRADSLGDRTLDHIDHQFPVVKKPLDEVYNDTRGYVLLPYNKYAKGRDHVAHVYTGERNDVKGDGIRATGKAAVATCLVIATQGLTWAREVYSPPAKSTVRA